jgi:small multidrug resistance family-3 protein
MSVVATFLLLLLAAMLEAGGDALVRLGIFGAGITMRCGLFAAGAAVLLAYAIAVNSPSWDFGKLLGVYVALFFVVAQVINLLVFDTRPSGPIFIGGTFIVAGGLIVTFWRA